MRLPFHSLALLCSSVFKNGMENGMEWIPGGIWNGIPFHVKNGMEFKFHSILAGNGMEFKFHSILAGNGMEFKFHSILKVEWNGFHLEYGILFSIWNSIFHLKFHSIFNLHFHYISYLDSIPFPDDIL